MKADRRLMNYHDIPAGQFLKQCTSAGAQAMRMQHLPQGVMTSLTWDRGNELAYHRKFTVATDVSVYFCDPKSPWQRGSAAATISPMACCANTCPTARIYPSTRKATSTRLPCGSIRGREKRLAFRRPLIPLIKPLR